MNKHTLYLTLKLTALTAVISDFILANTLDGLKTIGVLAFCCLFLVDLLVNRLCSIKKIRLICPLVEIAVCFFLGAEMYFPLLLMLIFELVDLLETGSYFYVISVTLAVLAALILKPDQLALICSVSLMGAGTFARISVERVEYFRELSEEQRKTISALNERISKLQSYSATLRETTALEERSRFSTRIHDKLGHGISGSIILLEGVKLNIRKNPEQAEKTLGAAIDNLRGSVDSIRAALREERPKRASTCAAELKEMLERFSVNYRIKTEFSVEGSAGKISSPIWNCIKENLTEALTNTVKHSNADRFSLKIYVYEKILRVEFWDNGRADRGFSKGMGLEGIEDRTSVCGGKCLFQGGVSGFKIINVFGVEYDKGINS